MQQIQNLLNQVQIIVAKNNQLLDATGGRFNIFSVIGVNHYETINSSILAELLNPKGSHGLKHLFLSAFIEVVNKHGKMCLFDCKTANVITEAYVGGNGRIDILIEDSNNHAIILENKIYANDQDRQLKRYNDYATTKYHEGNFTILYLTLDGVNASDNSGDGVSYISISFKETIIEWLEECVRIAVRYPIVRETINQYINHVKQLTNQDMENINKEEILEILSKKENLEAVFKISMNIENVKRKIFREKLIPQLKEIANEFHLELDYSGDDCAKIYGGITFLNSEWKHSKIVFEFGAANYSGMYYGIAKKEANYPMYSSSAVQDALKKIADLRINNGWWFCYKNVNGVYSTWNEDAFLAILNGKMKEYFRRIIFEMLDTLKGLDL